MAPPRPARLLLLLVVLGAPLAATAGEPASPIPHRAVVRLTRALEDPDRGVRFAAVVALGKAGAEAAALAPRLDDDAWCVRREAGWWLRRASPPGLAVLALALEGASPRARATAAWALSAFGKDGVRALVDALDDEASDVRLESVAALRRIGGAAREAIPALRRILSSEAPEAEAYEAALTLIVLSSDDCEAALPVVKAHLAKHGPGWRGLGALLLAGEAGARALDDLGVKNDRSETHRRVEVLRHSPATGQLGPQRAGPVPVRPASDEIMRPSTPPMTTAEATALAPLLAAPDPARALSARDRLRQGGKAVARPVARVVAEGSYAALDLAPDVFDALGRGGEDATLLLAALLDHEDVNVRETAARCLGAIGPGARKATSALVRALGDERLCVTAHAALALGRIGLDEALLEALDDPRARVRAYATWAVGWALGAAQGVDQVPFEMRLPVEDAGRTVDAPTRAEVEAARTSKGPRAEALAVLRRGIWSMDIEVALCSAKAVTYRELDATECERVMEILVPEGQHAGVGIDFDDLRSMLGSSELPMFVRQVARATRTAPDRGTIFSHCHRMSRADTLPALCFFGRTEEPEALRGWGELWMPGARTEIPVRTRAAFDLGFDPGPDEREILHALLRRDLDEGDGMLWLPELWLLNEHQPKDEDAPLLLEVAHALEGEGDWHHHRGAYWATLRALGKLGDPASERYLRGVSAREATSVVSALAALARRGDEGALERLVARSRESADALALLLEIAPRRGTGVLAARLTDPAKADACLHVVADVGPAATEVGARLSEDAWRGLEAAVAAAQLPAGVLGRIAITVPGCRTRRMAARLLDLWERDGPAVLERDEDDLLENPDLVAALLFSAEADRLRKVLRDWAGAKDEEVAQWARSALLRIGDPEHAEALIRWIGTAPRSWDDARPLRIAWLARSDGPVVRAWLRKAAVDEDRDEDEVEEACWTLAALQGWTGLLPGRDFDLDASPLRAWRHAIVEDRMADAHVAADEDAEIRNPVFSLLAHRAIAGDREARAALWSALRAGRYRWIQEMEGGWSYTLGNDPTTLPHWMRDLDSNCCRISDGLEANVFEDRYLDQVPWGRPLPYDAHRWGVGRRPSEQMREVFRLAGTPWVWSPLLDEDALLQDETDRTVWIPMPK